MPKSHKEISQALNKSLSDRNVQELKSWVQCVYRLDSTDTRNSYLILLVGIKKLLKNTIICPATDNVTAYRTTTMLLTKSRKENSYKSVHYNHRSLNVHLVHTRSLQRPLRLHHMPTTVHWAVSKNIDLKNPTTK